MASNGLYRVNLDADTARELAEQWATILLLDVPPGTIFGADLQMYTTGPKFCGLKMIPPGPHFFCYAPTDTQGGCGPVTGFFVFMRPKQEERYGMGVDRHDFDGSLGAYNIHTIQQWNRVSSCITADVIERIEPVGASICVLAESDDNGAPVTEAEAALAGQLAHARESDAHGRVPSGGDRGAADGEAPARSKQQARWSKRNDRQCHYVEFPRWIQAQHLARGPRAPEGGGVTSADITAANMDKSPALARIIEVEYKGKEQQLVGEMQFAFVAFLMGHSLDGFRQWKAMLHLLLQCEVAPLKTHTELYTMVLDTLHAQLEWAFSPPSANTGGPGGMPGDASVAEADQPRLPPLASEDFAFFLKELLQVFFEILEDADTLPSSVGAAVRLTSTLLAGHLMELSVGEKDSWWLVERRQGCSCHGPTRILATASALLRHSSWRQPCLFCIGHAESNSTGRCGCYVSLSSLHFGYLI
eukprot:jgi/Mesvir1/29229/Mv18823-RA.3